MITICQLLELFRFYKPKKEVLISNTIKVRLAFAGNSYTCWGVTPCGWLALADQQELLCHHWCHPVMLVLNSNQKGWQSNTVIITKHKFWTLCNPIVCNVVEARKGKKPIHQTRKYWIHPIESEKRYLDYHK